MLLGNKVRIGCMRLVQSKAKVLERTWLDMICTSIHTHYPHMEMSFEFFYSITQYILCFKMFVLELNVYKLISPMHWPKTQSWLHGYCVVSLWQADMAGERAIKRDEGERLARVMMEQITRSFKSAVGKIWDFYKQSERAEWRTREWNFETKQPR